MINYLIEFALIHVILFVAYKLLLSGETQLASKRMYLLSSTSLALVIPLIQLPNFTPIQNINITGSFSGFVLPEMIVGSETLSQSWYAGLSWWHWLFMAISAALAIRFLIALVRLVVLYHQSEPTPLFGHNIRHIPELETSFTFFNWIFIDKNDLDNAYNIIRHEEAHIKYGHSFDLLLLNLLTIPFWWVPSIWLAISELKLIHEYQADSYALGSIKYKSYLQTLIGHTLKQEGLILTNSFNDIPLHKRLNYMKTLKKKISGWKVMIMILIISITGYTFSCQQISTTELEEQAIENQISVEGRIFQIVDEPAGFNGGITEFYNYIGSTLRYTEKALKDKVSGKVFVEFVVNTDGSISNVKILRGIGYGLDEEAKRVVEGSPDWFPGKQKGHLIRQRMVLPITFRHPDSPEIEEVVEKRPIEVKNLPTYPGGVTSFYDYVKSNLDYPEEAKQMGLEGKVFVEFKVNTDGSISDVAVVRGIGAGCDEEAKRVIENSPKWSPMTVEGETREIKMVMPITFRLSGISKETAIRVIEVPDPKQ